MKLKIRQAKDIKNMHILVEKDEMLQEVRLVFRDRKILHGYYLTKKPLKPEEIIIHKKGARILKIMIRGKSYKPAHFTKI